MPSSIPTAKSATSAGFATGGTTPTWYASGELQGVARTASANGVRANKAAGDAVRDLIAAREAPALTELTFTTVGCAHRVDVLKVSVQ